MRTFRNEQMKITVEIENGEVTAYKDCSKSVLFPDGDVCFKCFRKHIQKWIADQERRRSK
jgi:hypothetical protein